MSQYAEQTNKLLQQLVDQQTKTTNALENIARTMKSMDSAVASIKADVYKLRRELVEDKTYFPKWPNGPIDASKIAELD